MADVLPTSALWLFSGIFFFLFIILAIINAVYLVGQIHSRFEYGPSLMPFFGGIFGLIAILVLPVGELPERMWWCWLPLLLDGGCLPYIVLGLYFSKTKKPE